MLLVKSQKFFFDWLCYILSKETTFPSRIFDEFEAFWYFLAIFQFWPYSKRSPKVKFENVKKQRVVVSTIWFFQLSVKQKQLCKANNPLRTAILVPIRALFPAECKSLICEWFSLSPQANGLLTEVTWKLFSQ